MLGVTGDREAKAEFMDRFEDHLDVDAFLQRWWPQVDPREVLLWLGRPRAGAPARRGCPVATTSSTCSPRRCASPSSPAPGRPPTPPSSTTSPPGSVRSRTRPAEERGFYEIEEFEDVSQFGVAEVRPAVSAAPDTKSRAPPSPTPASCSSRDASRPGEYAHVLVDEAQDLSPMQWRMLGRRGRYSSWTVVGDAAQASWPDAVEAGRAREEAFGSQERRLFHMDTNYRNAREIFDYAAEVVRAHVPDADIPQAVRETGVDPVDTPSADGAGLPRRGGRGPPRRGRGLDRGHHPRRRRGSPRSVGSATGCRHRPDVDQGPGVRRHRHRRPRRDHA